MTPLRQRMLEDMGIRNLAENTQSAYLQEGRPGIMKNSPKIAYSSELKSEF